MAKFINVVYGADGQPLTQRIGGIAYKWSDGQGQYTNQRKAGFNLPVVQVTKPYVWTGVAVVDGEQKIQKSKVGPGSKAYTKFDYEAREGYYDKDSFSFIETGTSLKSREGWFSVSPGRGHLNIREYPVTWTLSGGPQA